MTTILKPKRSEVQYSIPGANDLEVGELAMNIRDGKFYTKDSFNVVKEIGGAGSVSFQTVLSNGNKTTYDIWLNGSNLIFEGNYENAFRTNLGVVEPTQTRNVLIPNDNGTLAMDGDALAYSIVFG